MKACFRILYFLPILLFSCDSPINIHSRSNVPLSKIIEEVATQCQLNIIYLQENTKAMLDSKKMAIHIQNKPIKKVLDSLITSNDFYYNLHNETLKIGSLLTKTFEISYIATTRVGSSNTDIVFSQDNQIQSVYNTSLHNAPLAISNFELDSQSHKMAIGKATANNPNIGKSGTKIYSIDEIDFWGELHNEIAAIAYAPGDSYQPNPIELKGKSKDIIINKAAGLLTITATPTQMRRIEAYIKNLNEKIQKQVLIDVHIFSLQHTNNQTYGVDWGEFYKLGNLSTLPPSADSQSSNVNVDSSGNSFAINIFSQGVSINRIIEFLQTYGKVQSISNPKVLTLNNQPAIISVGSVLRYSQNTTYQTTTQGTSIQNNAQAFPSVFAGILLDVTPSIKDSKIILKINPSITKTKDIAIENQTTALETPPNLSTKQLSSLVQVKDGEQIILGGLIDKTEGQTIRKVPILGDIQLIKYLFSYKRNIKETQEMIIVISPHIINLESNITSKDRTIIDEIIDFSQKDTLKDTQAKEATKQEAAADKQRKANSQPSQDSIQDIPQNPTIEDM
ncbi:pilus (MSHA type) biogenesis protein MshL [uncultured Helicobacter sp.]|uniref:pilus (MSHA type) biogenesis protein MshL n=3 Tax=uncultured Helicobacter sp. TaxID=175537 RepID=UPI002636DCE6|nr:pilus (MSHA type) biogenesis protein MshL [uncultured Helicobacter sp.]